MLRRSGFTLIELLVALAIVAIATAVALPAYQASVRKSRRADAMTAAAQLQQAQERWRANHPAYNGSLGGGAADISIGPATPLSAEGYYTLAISSATATGYVVTATPTTRGGQDNDTACAPMVLTFSAGSTSYSPPGCWAR